MIIAFLNDMIPAGRWAVLLTSSAVVVATFRGFFDFGRGDQWIGTCLRSSIFLFALALMISQLGELFPGSKFDPLRLSLPVSIILALVATGHSLFMLWWLRSHSLARLRSIHKHIDHGMAIAALAEVDPAAAASMAKEARRLAAIAIIKDEGLANGTS